MADAIIAISEFTRDTAVKITGASRSKFHLVHHVPDVLPSPAEPPGVAELIGPRPFVFYPANFWRHKNHLALLTAMGRVKERGIDIGLICSGSLLAREAGWTTAVREAAVEDRVHHLGNVPRAQISWLYRHAHALVFPSLFEGFGIPLLEAMHAACAITCGNNTSQPDVARASALYFDASNPDSIAAAIIRICGDETLRSRLIAAGRERMQAFSVRKFIDGHLAAFATAQQRHTPLRTWYNERVRLPRSLRPRTTLTVHETRIAAGLLRAITKIPHSYETVVRDIE
jgi:glycosyltransferase involved in cell wall biosynthesis